MMKHIVERVDYTFLLDSEKRVKVEKHISKLKAALLLIPEDYRDTAVIKFNGSRHLVLEYVRPPTEAEILEEERNQKFIDEQMRSYNLKNYYELKEKLGL